MTLTLCYFELFERVINNNNNKLLFVIMFMGGFSNLIIFETKNMNLHTCFPFTQQGFHRVFDSMDDITLDIPRAHVFLEKFVMECAKDGIIPRDLVLKIPTRYDTTVYDKRGCCQ